MRGGFAAWVKRIQHSAVASGDNFFGARFFSRGAAGDSTPIKKIAAIRQRFSLSMSAFSAGNAARRRDRAHSMRRLEQQRRKEKSSAAPPIGSVCA
jgi:hypothetical protein